MEDDTTVETCEIRRKNYVTKVCKIKGKIENEFSNTENK